MNDFEQENKYIRAKERIAGIKKFYSSLMAYVVFIAFLAGLNYYTNGWNNPWFLWAAFGWGIGIVFHSFKAFGWLPYLNKNWEEKKIKEFMDKDDEPSNDRWT